MSKRIRLSQEQSLKDKFLALNWGFVGLILTVSFIGFLALYSAGGGEAGRWAMPQFTRFVVGFLGMLVIAMIDIKIWFRLSYLIYGAGLFLLVFVELFGHTGMGAQRWIDLGFIKLQPSEFMKIAVVMALARYFHSTSLQDIGLLTRLVIPIVIVMLPVAMVLLQPDLGTSLMIVFAGVAVFFVAGMPLWFFLAGIAGVAALAPVGWHFMHDYQKQRVMTFLNPESDPLGSGYHIIQSKIAIGSGGLEGKGFMQGTQSHLNFLPEKQTDFIFTLWAEEWGLFGGLFLLLMFSLIFLYAGYLSFCCRHNYGRFLAFGLMVNLSLYVFINTAMVMGLIPVVGAPLPLISYGGTAMLATLTAFGLIMSCSIHREAKFNRF